MEGAPVVTQTPMPQDTPTSPRRAPTATASGTGASGQSPPSPFPHIPVVAGGRAGKVLDEMPPDTSSLVVAGLEPQRRPWADVPQDILGIVAGRLPCVEDRARMRSVCAAWRAAARLHRPPPPPLPLLVHADFTFSSFSPDGVRMGARRVPLPEGVAADDVRCVGSFEGWLAGVRPNEGRYLGDGECFLMNPFSRDVLHLPPPSASSHFVDAHSRSLPIIGGSGVVECTINAPQYVMSFCKVILSSSPDSGSKCTVAAFSVHRNGAKLALWRPGMASWCVCLGGCISKFSDITFYQGKLYVLSELTTNLFVVEITDDGADCGLMVSRVERCVAELPEVKDSYKQRWNLVEWHGKLLLIARYLGGGVSWNDICKVGVYVVDLSTKPLRFTEINTLDGDCIFISPCSSKSFHASEYDGVESNVIYFIDGHLCHAKNGPPLDKFMYNLRDGTLAPFAADLSEQNFRAPDGKLMSPTWLFPSE
ncbi:hypothetical protein CFC21_107516 [Triticum aestivum]|uniref:KIB1-4 beta-propeller domain-containing protein n=2 Tax=Triticum aestivum TaxID=4565 RepID=A0A3B6T9W5_WHEAT|nr:uncharacterized protein LOC123166629 [Triticum aestivum]KAF7106806.1 hypothetical protein CFC21_107516 [Triticum aestivum]